MGTGASKKGGGKVECPIFPPRHDSIYDGDLISIDLGVNEIRATAWHPFWVLEGEELHSRPGNGDLHRGEDEDGALPGRWVNACDLREGDKVVLRGARAAQVRRVGRRHERMAVCNLTVRGLHTFAVGESQVLVHNVSGIEEHHSDPIFAGGDPNQITTPMSIIDHDNLHSDLYNHLQDYGLNPRPGVTAQDWLETYGRPAFLDAIAEFYYEYIDEYPGAASDFFSQWPDMWPGR